MTDLLEIPGHGVEGTWPGLRVRLGRAGRCNATPLEVTATYLACEGQPSRAFTFADRLRPGAEVAVAALRQSGASVILLSGDTEGAVAAMAQRLGITDWAAGALPSEKAARIAELAAAHVSISPASALDAARVASDIVLLGQDMAPIADALRIARQSARRIRENFSISAAYNVVAVPVALVGLATPLAAAFAMQLSSITVSLNALRLKEWKF